jgi:hypothetical protein
MATVVVETSGVADQPPERATIDAASEAVTFVA